ncbi:MAG: glycosyltransferase [Pyrinomonadaceae bacterium]|nr:glycosyltransferase [Pyrinomonadaceae bacterium]
MSDTTNPKMSILMLTYNHEKFIRQALDSVLMQQMDFDIEIVIADDYSQDSTFAIAREYQAGAQNINLLASEEKIGITRNLQRAFAACQGKYIAMLEGDDFWISPNKLSLVSSFLDQHQECSFCFHRVIRHDETSDLASVHPILNTTADFTVFTASDLARGNFVAGFSTCTYRREVIDSLDPGLWKLKVREWPFNIVVATHGPFGYVPEILSVYRAHWGGISSKKTLEEQRPILLEAIESYNKYLNFNFDPEFREFMQKLSQAGTDTNPASLSAPYRQLRAWVAAAMPIRLKRTLKKLLLRDDIQ